MQDSESPTAMAAPGAPKRSPGDPTPFGEYDIISVIGRGGMGGVYRARHRRLGKMVAIKLLPVDKLHDRSAKARFDREMLAVGAFEHKHIVRATDAGEIEGKPYLTMEYVAGASLAELAKYKKKPDIADICEMIRQTALGIQHAYESGMVHRDIKPSNLMLTKTGIVKILDFGIALLSNTHHPEDLTSTGQLMGTFDYMAPEQASDSHEVDIRADIYSLAATLYRLLAGRPLFYGENYDSPLKKLSALANETPAPLIELRPDVPAPLSEFIMRALAREVPERPQTPQELIDFLTPYCQGNQLHKWGQLAAKLSDQAEQNAGAVDQETFGVAANSVQMKTMLAQSSTGHMGHGGIAAYPHSSPAPPPAPAPPPVSNSLYSTNRAPMPTQPQAPAPPPAAPRVGSSVSIPKVNTAPSASGRLPMVAPSSSGRLPMVASTTRSGRLPTVADVPGEQPQEAEEQPQPKKRHRSFVSTQSIIIAVGLLAFVVTMLLLVFVVGAEKRGTISIETPDPSLVFSVKKNGKEVGTLSEDNRFRLELPVGEYFISFKGDAKGQFLPTSSVRVKEGKPVRLKTEKVQTSRAAPVVNTRPVAPASPTVGLSPAKSPPGPAGVRDFDRRPGIKPKKGYGKDGMHRPHPYMTPEEKAEFLRRKMLERRPE